MLQCPSLTGAWRCTEGWLFIGKDIAQAEQVITQQARLNTFLIKRHHGKLESAAVAGHSTFCSFAQMNTSLCVRHHILGKSTAVSTSSILSTEHHYIHRSHTGFKLPH